MKKALLFGINDYSGSANDLNGCINDVLQAEKVLTSLGFECVKFLDEEVTIEKFCSQTEKLIKETVAGDYLYIGYSGHGTQVPDKNGDELDHFDEALYLYDGPLIDDKTNVIFSQIKEGVNVVVAFDSCFSGTGTRSLDKRHEIRFHPVSGLERYNLRGTKKRTIYNPNDMRYVYLSGCSDVQTSADAYISFEYHGAFSWFLWKAFKTGITYREWHKGCLDGLKKAHYEQTPQIEGNKEFLDLPVFGTVLKKKKCFLNFLKFW
jgi:metacaspase-1